MRARLLFFLVIVASVCSTSGPVLGATRAPRVSPTRAGGATSVVPGRVPVIAWPRLGEGALAVAGVGMLGTSPDQRVVPIASVTKMMTALLVLKDHPLALGDDGPSLVIDDAEVADYLADRAAGDSVLPVAAGEVLDEYQLLEGLLIPSGDNIADLLATWIAGSVPAFAAQMNAEAATLGQHSTHYADASGVSAGSRSTAGDQAVIAATLMQSAVIRSIVRRPSVALPVAGVVTNYNPALGVSGIIGVKSGYTGAAQSCLVTAAFRKLGGHSVLVIAVVTGQPSGLAGAARVDESLLGAASAQLVRYRPVRDGEVLASIALPGTTVPEELVAAASVSVIGWPGLVLTESVISSLSPGSATAPGGAGAVEVAAPWGSVGSAPLQAVTSSPSG